MNKINIQRPSDVANHRSNFNKSIIIDAANFMACTDRQDSCAGADQVKVARGRGRLYERGRSARGSLPP